MVAALARARGVSGSTAAAIAAPVVAAHAPSPTDLNRRPRSSADRPIERPEQHAASRRITAEEMELPAVVVRDRRFHRPADASRGHARARGHAWWQRLRGYHGPCIAGFAIPCRIYWHSSVRVKAPLGEGQAVCRYSLGLFVQAPLLGEQPSRDDDRPDSLRFLRLARGGHPYAADPAAPSVADGHDCRRYGQPGQQAAEVVAAIRRLAATAFGSSPARQATQLSIPHRQSLIPDPQS